MRLTLITCTVFAIGLTLDRIDRRLGDIQEHLAVANCLAEARLGQRCPEVNK